MIGGHLLAEHGIAGEEDYVLGQVPPSRLAETLTTTELRTNPASFFHGDPNSGAGRRRRPKFELPVLTRKWRSLFRVIRDHFLLMSEGIGVNMNVPVVTRCPGLLRLTMAEAGVETLLDFSTGVRVFLEKAHDDDALFGHYLTLEAPHLYMDKCHIYMDICDVCGCCDCEQCPTYTSSFLKRVECNYVCRYRRSDRCGVLVELSLMTHYINTE